MHDPWLSLCLKYLTCLVIKVVACTVSWKRNWVFFNPVISEAVRINSQTWIKQGMHGLKDWLSLINLSLAVLETSLYAFANRLDPDQRALWGALWSEVYSVCHIWIYEGEFTRITYINWPYFLNWNNSFSNLALKGLMQKNFLHYFHFAFSEWWLLKIGLTVANLAWFPKLLKLLFWKSGLLGYISAPH